MKKFNLKIYSSILLSFICMIFIFSSVAADTFGGGSSTSSFNVQYSNPSAGSYSSLLSVQGNSYVDQEGYYDVQFYIPPLGCEPTVVRSDLLEEQDVPVFCKLAPLKINPGVTISRISGLSVTQKSRSDYITSVGFHPANALLQAQSSLVNTPTTDNIGYVVVVLKKQPNENAMPEYVNATLSATLQYSGENTFGLGENEFYIPVLTDEQFELNKKDYGFYDGIGYLRVEEINEDSAVISIYDTYGRRVFNQNIQKGLTSNEFYLMNSNGGQGIKITLKDITLPQIQATIKVNGNIFNVYRGQSFYNSKCTLSDVTALLAGSGTVRVSCAGKTFNLQKKLNNVNLEVDGNPKSAVVGEDLNFNLDDYYYYWAYSNTIAIPDTSSPSIPKNIFYGFIAQINKSSLDSLSTTEKQKVIKNLQSKIDAQVKKVKTLDAIKLIKISMTDIGLKLDPKTKQNKNILLTFISNENEDSKTVTITSGNAADSVKNSFEVKLKDSVSVNGYIDSATSNYFQKAANTYDNVNSLFSGEARDSRYSFGEYALWQEYKLANLLGQKEVELRVLSQIMNEYPNSRSESGVTAKELVSQAQLLSSEGSSDYYPKEDLSIELMGVKQPDVEQNNVMLHTTDKSISSQYYSGSVIYQSPADVSDPDYEVVIDSFTDDTVKFNCSYKVADSNGKLTQTIKNTFASGTVDTPIQIKECKNIKIVVDKINRIKVAQIKLTPVTTGKVKESNFSFSIGIEKRAIQLTPEEASQKIKDLDKDINKWNNISDSLSKFIEAEKAACLATTTLINIKNMIEGRSGMATARSEVMARWNSLCAAKSTQEQYGTTNVDDCIASAYNEKIEPEINAARDSMAKYNALENQARTSNSVLKGEQKDIAAKNNIITNISSIGVTTVKNAAGKEINVNEVLNVNNVNYSTYSDLSSLYVDLQMSKDPSLTDDARKQYERSAYDKLNAIKSIEDNAKKAQSSSNVVAGIPVSQIMSGSTREVWTYEGKTWKDVENNFDSNLASSNIQEGQAIAIADGKLFVFDSAPTKGMATTASKVYQIDSGTLTPITSANDASLTKYSFQAYDASLTKNACKNCNHADVYTQDPYKGMPSLLPFDCANGWYVQTEQLVTGGFGLASGSTQTYMDSGALNNFWLCNVGPNGMMEGKGIGDDTNCINFQLSTGQSINTVPGLNAAAAKAKVDDAIAAVRDAQRQMAANPSGGSIKSYKNSCGSLSIKTSSSIVGGRCTDFMSPKECQLIFNVCDPVVCPNSRCDLGGKFKVDNVIQSGIVGSTVLCLPNFIGFQGKANTGVVIPVCLTGINAGIEGWVSILSAYRGCLNESITNNKTVGICDMLESVYVCDFFYRQTGQFSEAVLRNLFNGIFEDNTQKGGAEYTFTADAWNNAQNSMQWMQTVYGKDSKLVFTTKDITNSIVAQFCKSSFSATYPTVEDTLTPESPVQYHASYEENSYTTATVPPTSQYKVFYSIYSGKDAGHYYSVYLKEPPAGIGYTGRDTVLVASGYVTAGQTATETKDFIDASGYKQLCIRIDNKDNCGFKSVSTSFAVNYAKDLAVNDQLSNPVTSQKECTSGTQSAGSLLTPNIQQGVTEFLNPELYNQGVTRICSGKNPGLTTDATRWKDVGYCGDASIRCWVDSKSVEKAIQGKGIENQTLSQINQMNINNLIAQGNYLSVPEADGAISIFEKVYLTDPAGIVPQFKSSQSNIENIYYKGSLKNLGNESYEGRTIVNLEGDFEAIDSKLITGSQKAKLLSIKAEVYDQITQIMKSRMGNVVVPVVSTTDYNADSAKWVDYINAQEIAKALKYVDAAAIAQVGSNDRQFNSDGTSFCSSTGACGIMQVSIVGCNMLNCNLNTIQKDPLKNIDTGIDYLAYLENNVGSIQGFEKATLEQKEIAVVIQYHLGWDKFINLFAGSKSPDYEDYKGKLPSETQDYVAKYLEVHIPNS